MIRIIQIFASSLLLLSSIGEAIEKKQLIPSIEPSRFTTGETTLMGSDEILAHIRPILRKRLLERNYDRISPILQFLDHYEACKTENAEISPLEAYKTLRLTPNHPKYRGGPCVDLTFDLYYSLPKDIQSYIVAAKLPVRYQQFAFPTLCHTALLIKFQNPSNVRDKGYILLDPAFDISECILLIEEGEPFIYKNKGSKGIWKFHLHDNKIICNIESEDNLQLHANHDSDFWRMIYFLDCLINPIESSATPMLPVDRRLSLLSRREDGSHLAHLNIELDKHRVIWSVQDQSLPPIPFERFMLNQWEFPQDFAEALFTDAKSLTENVKRIIMNKNIIDNLYTQYLQHLKQTEDFTITGHLHMEQLESILRSMNLPQ